MAFIDATYYNDVFHGTAIPAAQFARLAEVASDVIDGLITIEMSYEEKQAIDNVKKATAYQIEFMFEHGGIATVLGTSDVDNTSESLGDYSVSGGDSSSRVIKTEDGIPVSSIAINLLRKEGLTCRWMYANAWGHGD